MKPIAISFISLIILMSSGVNATCLHKQAMTSPQNEATNTEIDKRIAFMEETLKKIKAAKTPEERMKIMHSRSQAMRAMMASKMPEYMKHQRRHMQQQMAQMQNQPRMMQPPQWQPPGYPNMNMQRPHQMGVNQAYERHMQNMQRQIKMMNEQIQYQQKMLQEIMSYRAPIEKMLNEKKEVTDKQPMPIR